MHPNPQIFFTIVFIFLVFLVILFDKKYGMLRDITTAANAPKPYSFARVQLAWWSVIVISAFAAIIIERGLIPTFRESTLILLGISAGTMATAKLTDLSDKNNPNVGLKSQNEPSQGFFLDILSDTQGVSISRFQTVLFNLIFGVWFIYMVWGSLNLLHLDGLNHIWKMDIDTVIPDLVQNSLILIGLSSGTYAALKTTENK